MIKSIDKKFDLDFLGEGWKGTYLKFKGFSVGELSIVIAIGEKVNNSSVSNSFDSLMTLLKAKFIEGEVLDDKNTRVNLTKDELDNLPTEIINPLVSFLIGQLNPKG